MSSIYQYSVFTKAWHALPLPELGKTVKDLGFDGVELALRPGFHDLGPENTEKLPEAARILGDCGIKIRAVAGPLDERTIAACGEANIPFIRICAEVSDDGNFFGSVAEHQKRWDELVPALDKAGVAILVQNHFSPSVANAAELHSRLRSTIPGTSAPPGTRVTVDSRAAGFPRSSTLSGRRCASWS